MIFQAPAVLSRVGFLKDGGVSLGFSTQELSDTDKVLVAKFFNEFGFVLFKTNEEFQPHEIPKEDADMFGKTPSRRMRSVLYLFWQQKPDPKPDFDQFYRAEMERLIEHYKSKLD